jgi:hypothetical protein
LARFFALGFMFFRRQLWAVQLRLWAHIIRYLEIFPITGGWWIINLHN